DAATAIVLQRAVGLASEFANHSYSLLLTQGLHRLQQRGLARWIKSRGDAGNRERKNGDGCRRRNDARRIESFGSGQGGENRDQCGGDGQPDASAQGGQERAFHKKLGQNRAMGRSERFAQSDLAGAFGNGDEHDVDDADRAEGERDHTDHAEKIIHAVKDLADALVIFDVVPVFKRLGEFRIEPVAAGKDVVDLLFCHQIPAGREWTVVQERDGIFAILLLQPEQVAHGLDGNKDARVGAVVAILPDLAEHPDNFEANAIEQDGRAHGWASGEYVLEQFPTDDGHPARFGIVLIVEPAARADGDRADLVVLGRDTEHLAVRGAVVADRANVFAVETGETYFSVRASLRTAR